MRKVIIVTSTASKNSILKYAKVPLIGVENGIELIYKLNLPIALGIGDFDTLDYQTALQYLKRTQIVRLNKDKDISDTEGAINYMEKLGFDEMVILASVKGRYDVTHNLLLLTKKYPNCKVSIEDDTSMVTYLKKGSHLIQKQDYRFLGFFGFPEGVISIDNSLYRAKKMKVNFTESKVISGDILDRVVDVEVHSGGILLIQSKEDNSL